MVLVAGIIIVRMMGGKEAQTVSTPTFVETAVPQIADIRLYTSLLGKAEPEQSAVIHPEAGGTVTEVFIKAGDRVTAGQALCIIDTKQVENAKNTMENAQVAYQEAQTNLGRMTPLYQGGFISDQEYDECRNAAQRAQISLRQALEDYERQYSYSHVTAPIGGRIEMCGVEALERVSAEDTICIISGEGNQIVATSLTEQLHNCVQVGDSVEAEKNGVNYMGTVTEISEMADPSTGLYEMKLRLPDTAEVATVVMCLLCLVVFGFSSVKNSRQELTPEMNNPILMVMTTYSGAQPSDVDSLISQKIESAAGSLSGVKKISSTSSEGRSSVVIQYNYGTDLDQAYDDLKKEIDAAVPDLPDAANTPVVLELDTSSSADMTLIVSREGEENQYGYVNREIVPEFEKLADAAEVSIAGGSEDFIRVQLIPE